MAGDRGIALVVAKNLLRLLAGYVRAANVTRAKVEAAAPASGPGRRRHRAAGRPVRRRPPRVP